MIRFNPVRLADKQTIESYTLPSGIDNCDLAFANMFCWEFKYRSAWAEQEGFLLIRFQIDGGERIGYMQPVGEGDFGPILPLLREDAHAHGQRLRIIGLTDEGRDTIRRIVPCHFAFESDRALEDYVYNADDLRNLAGRRYQPKRNHINRFVENNPTWTYEEITPATLPECLEMDKEWYRRSLQREGELTGVLIVRQGAGQAALRKCDFLDPAAELPDGAPQLLLGGGIVVAAVKAADGDAVAPQGVDLPAQLGAAHSEGTLQLPAGDGVCLALVVEVKILCKGFVDLHSSSFPGPLSRSRRSNQRKKEGAAFPRPGIRPLAVIFFIHSVHSERTAFYMLL